MLSLSSGYLTHAVQETTDFCTLWRITRTDSVVFRFTDHDRDVVMSDGTYLASGGYSASAARTQAGLNVDDLEVGAVFDSAFITEEDLEARRARARARAVAVAVARLQRECRGAARGTVGGGIDQLRGAAGVGPPYDQQPAPRCRGHGRVSVRRGRAARAPPPAPPARPAPSQAAG
jgi:hypothetical protein